MSRHPERQKLARDYGATGIVEERGEEGIAKIKELTGGLGAHSVVEAVGTQESFMQAVGATRGGGHLGYVGVNYDVSIPGSSCSSPASTPWAALPPYAGSSPT